jgi:PAS domain S-box-containing protein
MKGSANSTCLGDGCCGRNVLARSESDDLRGLVKLVDKIFQTPVAYAAMLGHRDRVMSRVGSGEKHWKYMKTFPLSRAVVSPVLVRDVRAELPPDADVGELRFVASAPIRTLCGQSLGALVIADLVARPEFSDEDLKTLLSLAAVVTGIIEIRVIAAHSVESDLRYHEAETRFRAMAGAAPSLIACYEADGSCGFVNDRWLEFTGRRVDNELGDGWQQTLHHRHRERVLTAYWRSLQERLPFTLEVPMLRCDGGFRWMSGSATPRFLKDGTFAGFVLSLTDVSACRDEA